MKVVKALVYTCQTRVGERKNFVCCDITRLPLLNEKKNVLNKLTLTYTTCRPVEKISLWESKLVAYPEYPLYRAFPLFKS